jgi:hypothetical protein
MDWIKKILDWIKRVFGFQNPMPPQKLYRQGDVLLRRVGQAETAVEASDVVTLVLGEATGHAHRVFGAAVIWSDKESSSETDVWMIDVAIHGALLRHVRRDDSDTGEHGPIALPSGRYVARRQREYDPEAIRHALD